MLHLPCPTGKRTINRIAANLPSWGHDVGPMGESRAGPSGALYQLSNQVTFGTKRKQEAIDNLKSIAMQLMKQERAARSELVKILKHRTPSAVPLASLRSAKLLSNDEFMKADFQCKAGDQHGLIEHLSLETINALMVRAQPATIQSEGKSTSCRPNGDSPWRIWCGR